MDVLATYCCPCGEIEGCEECLANVRIPYYHRSEECGLDADFWEAMAKDD